MATYTEKPLVNKRTLVNYIRHADTSNKVMEEREMWRMRGLEVRGRFRDLSLPVLSPEQQHSTIIRGRLVSDSVVQEDDADEQQEKRRGRDAHGRNYWFKQLMKAEENDPDRWGHSGYKELYPDECLSSSGDEQTLNISRHCKTRHSNKKSKKKKSKRQGEEVAVVVVESESSRRKREKKSKARRHRHKHDSGVNGSSRRPKHGDERSKKLSRKRKLVRNTNSSSSEESSSPHLTQKRHREY